MKNIGNFMSIFRTDNLDTLKSCSMQEYQLGIAERVVPNGADIFFQKVLKKNLGVKGQVRKASALADIEIILKEKIDKEIQNDPFYDEWLLDISKVCIVFCDLQKSSNVDFYLSTKRGCRRYHIDNVPQRMLVTYAGKGTEWLPDDAANRNAFLNGEPNEKIIIDKTALQFLKAWDVAVFRGGSSGLLHRTPDDALKGKSILLRLDHPTYWKNLIQHQKQSGEFVVM